MERCWSERHKNHSSLTKVRLVRSISNVRSCVAPRKKSCRFRFSPALVPVRVRVCVVSNKRANDADGQQENSMVVFLFQQRALAPSLTRQRRGSCIGAIAKWQQKEPAN